MLREREVGSMADRVTRPPVRRGMAAILGATHGDFYPASTRGACALSDSGKAQGGPRSGMPAPLAAMRESAGLLRELARPAARALPTMPRYNDRQGDTA